MDDGHAHITSTRIDREAGVAFDYLSSPQTLGQWARGMGKTRVLPGGLVEGTFPGDGAPIFARIEAQQIHAALQRIDAGTYGECATCGEPISEPRLEALPYAMQCINCARG